MEYDYEDFKKIGNWDWEKTMDDVLNKMGITNIIIAGKTGVGKSTLINSVFDGNIAKTGQGRPVTKEIKKITKEKIPVALYDTEGLELTNYKKVTSDLLELIIDKRKIDPKEHIHVAWICLSEDSRRIEEPEIELVKKLSEYIPVISVITKARNDNGFKKLVEKDLYDARNCVRVRAVKEELDEGHILNPMGLETLIDVTTEVLPDAHRKLLLQLKK